MNGRNVLIAVLAALLILLTAVILPPALGMRGIMGFGGMAGMMGRASEAIWPNWLLPLSGLLSLVGAVLLFIWAIHHLPGQRGPNGDETPLVILQRRYARGDVDADEYERLRAHLTHDRGNS